MKMENKEGFMEEDDLSGHLRLLDFDSLRIEEVRERANRAVYHRAGCTPVAAKRLHCVC